MEDKKLISAKKIFASFPDPAIILMAVLSVIIHLIITNNLEYHRDELLYFSLGQHPAFGYNSVPPLIGWVAWLMQTLFGHSVFVVRLFPALLGGALILLTASIVKELGGSKYASFLAAFGLMIAIFFQRTYFLFMPVHIEVFLWTLLLYMIIKYLNTLDDNYLLYFGIIAGISLLNKYLVGILFLGLILIIPFTKHRDVFRKRMFYTGIAAGFIIFLPNLIWQISKGLPVFGHVHTLYGTQLVHMNIPVFLTEQIMMPAFASVFTIAGLIYLLSLDKAQKFRIIGVLAVFVIMSLMLLRGKSYYTLGVFPLLIAAGAVSYENWIRKGWIRVLLPVILFILTIPIIPFGLPVYNSAGLIEYFRVVGDKYGIDLGRRFEDGSIHSLPQDYADMLGWEELAEVAGKAWNGIPDKSSAFIYCENYGHAGAITVIGKKYGLPEAVSFNESFRYWYPKSFNPDIKTLIYINHELGDDIRQLFKKITIAGKISNPDAREFGTTVYLCEEPVMSFNKFWTERLKNLK
jgi:hypothetical protein